MEYIQHILKPWTQNGTSINTKNSYMPGTLSIIIYSVDEMYGIADFLKCPVNSSNKVFGN